MRLISRTPAVIGALMMLAFPCAAEDLPADLTLGNLSQTYDGTGKTPSVASDPSGLSVELGFVEPEPVFTNFPANLPLSLLSLSFSAQATFGLGDYLELAPGARNVTSIDTALVTWAKAADYPTLAAANPNGWHHPITISVYSMDADDNLAFVGENTNDVFIPWRPLTLPNGNPYPYNGFAFRARVSFPESFLLPDDPVILVSYNTRSHGFNPIGVPGPYGELNMAVAGYPASIGADKDSAAVLWVREDSWSYPTSGTPTPLFQVNASVLPPSSTPPVNAGTYQVNATVTEAGYIGSTAEEFIILPASAAIAFGDLVQVSDGDPKTVTTATTPPGLSVEVLYNGSPNPPSALGLHPVTAAIDDPNYVGSANETLVLGYEFPNWISPKVAAGDIPIGLDGPNDDPDLDGIVNLMEYALGLDPASPPLPGGDPAHPFPSPLGGGLSLVYRRNLLATDLQFDVFTTSTPELPATWIPTSTSDVILSTDGSVQTIQATIPGGLSGPRAFARLGIQ